MSQIPKLRLCRLWYALVPFYFTLTTATSCKVKETASDGAAKRPSSETDDGTSTSGMNDPFTAKHSLDEMRTLFNLFVEKHKNAPKPKFVASDAARMLKRDHRPKTLNIKFRTPITPQTKATNRTAPDKLLLPIQATGGIVKRQSISGNFINAEFPQARDDRELAAVIDFLKADSRIALVEPDYVVTAVATSNDSRLEELWGLRNAANGIDIKANAAWDITTGSRNVIVGVIDSGIDCTHPDLAENCWTNPGESGLDAQGVNKANNKVDDDGNGFVDDWQGWDFIDEDNLAQDGNSHGTHVAGTIGAVGNNGRGIAGVNWQVSLVPLRFLDSYGRGYTSDAIEAVEYATKMKFFATNNSWGGGGRSQILADAIQRANDAGVLFVAAAGNSTRDNDMFESYPANYDVPNVISVAALNRDGNLAWFSNYGNTTVDIAAPGDDILSAVPGDKYELKKGTSMAAPHVTGSLALLKAQFPEENGLLLMTRLYNTIDVLQSLLGKLRFSGIINVHAALLARQDTSPPSAPTDIVVGRRSTNRSDLAWTASGDDDTNGAAAGYEARISNQPITQEADWNQAKPVTLAIKSIDNSRISGILTDLPLGFQGWIALKARDESGNRSTMSPSVELRLLPLKQRQFHNGTSLQSFPETPWVVENDPERGPVFSDGIGPYEPNSRRVLTLPELTIKDVNKVMLTYWQRASLEEYWDSGNVIVTWDGKSDETVVDFVVRSTSGWEKRSVDLTSQAFAALADGARSIRIQFILKSDSKIQFEGWLIDDIEIYTSEAMVGITGIPTGPSNPGDYNLAIKATAGSFYTAHFSEGDSFASKNCSDAKSYDPRSPRYEVNQPIRVTQTELPRKFLCLLMSIPPYQDEIYAFFEWNLRGPTPDVRASGMPSGVSNIKQFTLKVTADSGSTATSYSYALVNSVLGQELSACSASGLSWSSPLPLTTTPEIDLRQSSYSLRDGPVALCLRGSDREGNQQSPPRAYTWLIDFTPPDLIVTPTFPRLVNSNIQVFTVTASQGAGDISGCYFKVNRKTEPCPAAIKDYSSCHVAPRATGFYLDSDGRYTLCISAIDAARNQTPPLSLDIELDTSPPVAILSGTPPTSSKSPAGKITVSGSDVVSYIYTTAKNRFECQSWLPSRDISTPIELQLTANGDGPQALCVKGYDMAGNQQTSSTAISWIQDTIANPIRFLGSLPSSESNATTLSLGLTADERGTYRYALSQGISCDQAKLSAANERPLTQKIWEPLGATDGPMTVCAVLTDAAGNIQTKPTMHTWIKDTMAPIAEFIQTPAKISTDPSPEFKVATSDITEYQWTVVPNAGSQVCKTAAFSVWIPVSTSFRPNLTTLGVKTACLRGKDKAGNVQPLPTMYSWTVARPTAPIASVSGDTPFSPTSKSSWTIKIDGERVKDWQYAVIYSHNTDCKARVPWTPFRSATDSKLNPMIFNDTKADGFRTLCFRGRDAFGITQTNPTIMRWVKHAEASSMKEATVFGTITRQPLSKQQEIFHLTRQTEAKPAETVELRICAIPASGGLFTSCRTSLIRFEPNASSGSSGPIALPAGTWTILARPTAGRGSVEPVIFRK